MHFGQLLRGDIIFHQEVAVFIVELDLFPGQHLSALLPLNYGLFLASAGSSEKFAERSLDQARKLTSWLP